MERQEYLSDSVSTESESRQPTKSTAPRSRAPAGIKIGTRLLLVLACLALLCIVPLVLANDANPPSLPVTTDPNGTSGYVNGGLYVKAYQPVAWDNMNNDTTNISSRDFSQAFDIPDYTSIAWARLYVVVYSGSGIHNWPLQMNVSFDSGNNTVTTLDNATLQTESAISGSCYWVNGHVNKVYSDYMAWYDVGGLLNSSFDPTVYVHTNRLGSSDYDGRLKAVELVIAYNDDSEATPTTYYWVNQGHEWFHGGYGGTLPNWNNDDTIFDTDAQGLLGFTAKSAHLTVLSTTRRGFDATYEFNDNGISSSNLGAPYNYFINNTWDVTGLLDFIPLTCDLNYKNSSNTGDYSAGSYKIETATLAITV